MDTTSQKKISIDLTDVIGQLEAMTALTRNEFSGFGWGKWASDAVYKIHRVEVLDVRTFGYTEISPQKVARVMHDGDAVNARMWFHRHPLGNAHHPGPENWSSMDHATAREQRMYYAQDGKIQSFGWTVAIVRTPTGWTGRLDTFGKNAGTVYCEVFPNPALDLHAKMEKLALEYSRQASRVAAPGSVWQSQVLIPVNDEQEYEFTPDEERAIRDLKTRYPDATEDELIMLMDMGGMLELDEDDEDGIWTGMGEDPEDEALWDDEEEGMA